MVGSRAQTISWGLFARHHNVEECGKVLIAPVQQLLLALSPVKNVMMVIIINKSADNNNKYINCHDEQASTAGFKPLL